MATGNGPTSEADLRARLYDIERHLREMPPHNASGSRDELERQRDSLQRQLSRAARGQPTPPPATPPPSTTVVDPRASAPRSPAGSTPALRPGAFRRTTHVAAGPMPGSDYGDGVEVARDLHGGCRDVRATGDGHGVTVLAEASITSHLDVDRRMTHLEVTPGPTPEALVGQAALPGLRSLVAANVEDTSTARAAVLLDLGIGGNLAAYGRMQAGRRAGNGSTDVMRKSMADRLGDSCRGWANNGELVAAIRAGSQRPSPPPALVPEQSDDGWHDLGALPAWWVRRRRRIDVLDLPHGQRIEAAFRDSWADADGNQRALHEWEITLEVDADGLIILAEAQPRSLPFSACPLVADDVPGLVGASVLALRQAARDVLGGAVGCTHLNDLLSTIPSAVMAAARSQEG